MATSLRRTLLQFTFMQHFSTTAYFSGCKFTLSQPINLYRKFTADYIFTGYKMLPVQQAIITDDKGCILDLVPVQDAGDEIQILEGLICPGFINAHCHIELSHLKGVIPEGGGLVNFVQQVITQRKATDEVMQQAIADAAAEMYQSGIVAVGDICNTANSIFHKKSSPIYWHNFIEVSGFVDAVAEKRLAEMEYVYTLFKKMDERRLTTDNRQPKAEHAATVYSPHSPYSVSKKLFQLLNEQTAGQLISIHNQECVAENELYQHKTGGFLALYKNLGIDISGFKSTGLTSLQSWLPFFTRQQSIILVHNTFTSQADIDFTREYSHRQKNGAAIYHCLCINANEYIEQQAPPINLLWANNCSILIGTDSYASNRQLNMLEEIKSIQLATNNAVPLPEVLGWATINGAKALQMQHVFGSIEKGKQPGLVHINHVEGMQLSTQSTATRII